MHPDTASAMTWRTAEAAGNTSRWIVMRIRSKVGYMPLNDVRVLALTCSDTSIRIRIGRLDSDCHFVPDHTGAEVEYFFGGERDSNMIMGLSDEEWSEWKPVSVFMPNRYPVFYPQG